ncbi:hypothetical protein Ae201684P_013778 [Aphanomyces euteiches]|uniref:RRM domain-containing protein n=1 Tax=Aphanomyces euteiches TaxID=100861 RepID=A0A6G0WLM2_9STRA|nr:hypothetical protein Ae201684_014027 [Aphanomyces euteiches]KAH9082874.1 hypothetical protein Ae201684P_013778 [Aphanomyces euteiches]KAH9155987.1 hypothetical protein AeRB84_002086 [Aphanomyces euteiches]
MVTMEDNRVDSDSSSLDSDLDEEIELNEGAQDVQKQERIIDLICQSNANPYDYDLHITAITDLSSDPLYSSQLEQQFERFHAFFPLSVNLWLQYIALNPDKLPDAFEDYLEPILYYKYVEDLEGDDDAAEKWSTVLRAIGSHWSESEKVYDMYRSFLKESIDDSKTQSQRVKASYQAQLTSPYFDGSDRVLSEYRAWLQYQPNPDQYAGELQSIDRLIRGGRSRLKKMQEFESTLEKIANSGAEVVQQSWLDYCNFVIKHVKVVGCAIVISVLERAVAAVCLSSVLWQRYLKFLEAMNMSTTQVAKRATRNVPFVATPWVALLVAMELENKPSADRYQLISDLCKRKPLPLPQEQLLEVLFAHCDGMRRTGGPVLTKKAFKLAKNALVDWPLGKCCILMYEAKWSTTQKLPAPSGVSTHWNELWEEILSLNGGGLTTWQTCITECIREGGTIAEIRGYYERGITTVQDYPGALAEAWVTFEREMGDDVRFWLIARDAYDKFLQEYHQKSDHLSKTSDFDTNNVEASVQKNTVDEATKSAKKAGKKSDDDASLKRKRDAKSEEKQSEYKKQKTNDELNNRTVFLCELDKFVVKEELETLFASCGHIKEVRLVVRNRESQASRGMAYIEFEDEAGAINALKLDKVEFKGHPLNVKISSPPTKSLKSTEKDGVWKTSKTTLYVSKLDDRISEDGLRLYFAKFGQVNDVIILDRRHKKENQNAYALVEFQNEDAVSAVLKSSEGEKLTIQDCAVDVKRSRFTVIEMKEQQAKSRQKSSKSPKLDQQTKTIKPANVKEAKKPAIDMTRFSQKSMVPRSLARGKPQSKTEQPAMKSNSDFKKLYSS